MTISNAKGMLLPSLKEIFRSILDLHSIADVNLDDVLILDGLAKRFRLPGWKIVVGYVFLLIPLLDLMEASGFSGPKPSLQL